jgi:hypothetical protein
MNVTVSSTKEADYLVIRSTGYIESLEELKELVTLYMDEAAKHGIEKVLIDETEIRHRTSSLAVADRADLVSLVEFYGEVLPAEASSWKVCVVPAADVRDLSELWEFQVGEMGLGFRSFPTIEEAREFMRE